MLCGIDYIFGINTLLYERMFSTASTVAIAAVCTL